MTIAGLYELLAIVSGYVLNLVGLVRVRAQESSAFAIENGVRAAVADLESPTIGLSEIVARLADIQTAIVTLGTPQQTGVPVTLPTTPPTGYAGPALSDIGDEVWNYPIPDQAGFRTLDAIQFLNSWLYTQSQSQSSLRVATYSGYRVTPGFGLAVLDIRGPTVLNLDFTTILPTDASILAWASRVYPSVVWSSRGEDIVFEIDSGNEEQWWIIDLTLLQFRAWQAAATPTVSSNPPVWPGLANVTLGTSAPLAAGVTITEVMDGVIITITSAPAARGQFDFDGEVSYRNVGALIFGDDNGQYEFPQTLGLASGVYTPLQMFQASQVKVRTGVGVTGTVQAWRRTV